MTHLVAIFPDSTSARQALRRLREAGLPEGQLHLELGPGTAFMSRAGPSQPQPGPPGYRHQGVLESIGSFFASLFESHTDEWALYAQALRQGRCLVAVQALDAQQLRLAIGLARECGAIDVRVHPQGPGPGSTPPVAPDG